MLAVQYENNFYFSNLKARTHLDQTSRSQQIYVEFLLLKLIDKNSK